MLAFKSTIILSLVTAALGVNVIRGTCVTHNTLYFEGGMKTDNLFGRCTVPYGQPPGVAVSDCIYENMCPWDNANCEFDVDAVTGLNSINAKCGIS
ncbi:unnamed protein product [Zymoseptoria tritici ST99CH_3D1]|uniref:Uncharacterized protein n=1 Tax=Zymoseptoria tritici ST99CH_1E4 TaxID=1276532 RepID=A0A2H1H313_ZYMTR|nr:unnamed protein product [Zymoseptoria tritici ST99CH_1E4]SMR63311.1 unnamed protein product [Zymoseptoria tritici ST99CH_3D1]